MDQYNQQINPQFNPPQEPKPGRGKWFIIGGAVLLFIGILVFFAIKIGKGFGDKVGKLATDAVTMQDSLSKNTNQSKYDQIYASLGNDPVSKVYRAKIDSLKARTERINTRFDNFKTGFRDTLHTTKAIMFDKRISHAFFIKTGRAAGMRVQMLDYRTRSLNEIEDQASANIYKNMLMIDEMKNTMPVFKKFLAWENIYFDQPCQTVLTNITTLKTQVNAFELALLEYYEVQINADPDIVPDTAFTADSIPDSIP